MLRGLARLDGEEDPMAAPYRIFGAEISPYSVKVRSYFRYKEIPHEWIRRNAETQADYQKYAKLPLIPLVVTPEGEGIQDSTPIIERLEEQYPEPSIHPDDPSTAFIFSARSRVSSQSVLAPVSSFRSQSTRFRSNWEDSCPMPIMCRWLMRSN